MQEESRLILYDTAGRKPSTQNLADAIRTRITPLRGVNLESPLRERVYESLTFD